MPNRTHDPRPLPRETLQGYIDRVICHNNPPHYKEMAEWGWPDFNRNSYFEPSFVVAPADADVRLRHNISWESCK